jgi:hypothetical protein
VQRLRLHRPLVPYLLLLTSLLVGWWVAGAGGFPSTTSGRIAAVVVLTCPLLFSGMVFSTLLAGTTDLAAVLAVNLLGAMVGGMLEYNSMYFGFRFLYLLAIVLYGAAFVMGIAGRSGAQGREPSLVPNGLTRRSSVQRRLRPHPLAGCLVEEVDPRFADPVEFRHLSVVGSGTGGDQVDEGLPMHPRAVPR